MNGSAVQKGREGAVAELAQVAGAGGWPLSPRRAHRHRHPTSPSLSPKVYHSLVIGRRWSLTRYQHWLAETLIAQLLAEH